MIGSDRYEKNEPLLELLLTAKPLSLLGIIDEQCSMGKATDSTMIAKFHETFNGHKDYTPPKGNADEFTLRHYAGDIDSLPFFFCAKNCD